MSYKWTCAWTPHRWLLQLRVLKNRWGLLCWFCSEKGSGWLNTAERCLFSCEVKYGEVVVRRQIAPNVHMWPLASVNEAVYDITLAVSLWLIRAEQQVAGESRSGSGYRQWMWERRMKQIEIETVHDRVKKQNLLKWRVLYQASGETFTPSYEMKQSVYMSGC